MRKIGTDIQIESDCVTYSLEPMTLDKLDFALKMSKNRRVAGIDGINIELLKNRRLMLKMRLLHLMNTC